MIETYKLLKVAGRSTPSSVSFHKPLVLTLIFFSLPLRGWKLQDLVHKRVQNLF